MSKLTIEDWSYPSSQRAASSPTFFTPSWVAQCTSEAQPMSTPRATPCQLVVRILPGGSDA